MSLTRFEILPAQGREINTVLLAIGVSLLVSLVPTRHGHNRAADLLVQLDGVLCDVAEALHARDGVLGPNPEFLQGFSQREDHTVTRRLSPTLRAAHADRLARDEAGVLAAVERFELVEHPQHVLGVRHDVRSGHITNGSDIARYRPNPRAAQSFLLALTEAVRRANHAALAATQGDVDDGALPGHPHREGPDGVDRLLRVETDSTLTGAAGVVVLDPEGAEHLHGAVVHPDREAEMILAHRLAQQIAGRLVKAE
jgi:hypothetical protein